jgi:hypothetical protein
VTPYSRVIHEELLVAHLVKKFLAKIIKNFLYRVHRDPPFFAVLSHMNPAYGFISVLILSYHLYLDFPNNLI